MNKIETAWAIGLFEGEGSMVSNMRGHGTTLSIQMTDEDIVRRFYRIVGIGNVGGPYRNKHHQITWTWRTARAVDVKNLLEAWTPFMGLRRRKRALQALERLKLSEAPEIRTVCRRGHPWIEGNVYIAPKTGIRSCRICIKLRGEGGIA